MLKRDMMEQQKALAATPRRRWVRKVIKPVMLNGVLVRFLTGKGPGGKIWKSASALTKMGGRWSAGYNKRPSGDMVTADKTRNVDTTELADSFRAIECTADKCKVGPRGERNRNIAKREAGIGNMMVGWDTELKRACDQEMSAYAFQIAQGKEPPYLPRSRIGKRNVSVT